MRALFFCGHKSLYGISHLKPLIDSPLKIVGIVLATEERWKKFEESLIGKQYLKKPLLPRPFVRSLIGNLYNKALKVWHLIKSYDRIWKIWCLIKPNSTPTINVKRVAQKHHIPVFYVDDVNSNPFIETVDKLNPDLIICAAYPQIFKRELLEKAKIAAINFHPSLLPKFRGAHPHFWAIASGEKKSGITAHFMTEKIDDGDIVARIEFSIEEYTYQDLYKRIVEETPKLVNKVCNFFLEGQGEIQKQDESEATYRNDRIIHHRIFWNLHTTRDIYNLVRTGEAFCFFRGRKILIHKCYLSKTNRNLTNKIRVEEGTIVDIYKNSLVVKGRGGCVNIESVSYNGKKMSFMKFSTKYKVEIGEKLE